MIPSRDLFPRYSAKIDSWSFTGAFGRNFERLINLQMWCFGCDNGRAALCVKRFERAPKILEGSCDPTHIFKPHDLPPFREPRSSKERSLARTLLQHLFEELHGYETYITTVSHPAYRRECVLTSPRTGRLQGRREPCEAWALLASRQNEIGYTPAEKSGAIRASRERDLHLMLAS